MDVLSSVRDNWFKLAASTLLVFAATCGGSAEDKLTGGPTPSPPGAAWLKMKNPAAPAVKWEADCLRGCEHG
jgi:hypothetical protein